MNGRSYEPAMRRILRLLTTFTVMIGSAVHAQITITWAHLSPFCDPSTPAKAIGAVHWSGGTPPYTINIYAPNGYSIQATDVMSSPFFIDETLGNFTYLSDATAWVSDGSSGDGSDMQNLGDFDAIATSINLLSLTLTATNCASGVFTASFADNVSQDGDLFAETIAGYTWTLLKNGSAYASGSLSSVLQTNPSRLVFTGLTYGQYILELDLTTGSGQTVMYCPGEPSYAFCVPRPNDCQTNVSVRVALASVLGNGGLMSDALRAAGLLPLAEPYSGLGYTYVGTAPGGTTTSDVLAVTGNDAIVDWVVLELRSHTTPATIIASRPALLQRDGDVVDLDGDPYVAFPVPAGLYKIAVRHRNHLACMSSSSYTLTTDPCRGPDLKAIGAGTFGTNARKLMTVPGVTGNLWGLWPGDATGDGLIRYTGAGNDRDPVLTAVGSTTPNNTVPNVYDRRDTNLDGVIKYTGSANDRDLILTNVGSTTPNNTRTQQLP